VETDLFPLIIATRGRAGKAPTIQAAREQGLGHMLVVEPAEVDAYRAAYPGSLVWPLGRDGGGLPYVRQWIHDHALVLGWGWYWMPDDDITAWYQVVDGKCVATPMGEALRQSQHYFDGPKPAHQLLAQAALDLRQFAWAAKAPWKLNTYCDTVVAIHAQRARYIDYRPSTDLKADRDYTLQLITSGWLTMRISAYAFSMPTNGTNAGQRGPEHRSLPNANALVMVAGHRLEAAPAVLGQLGVLAGDHLLVHRQRRVPVERFYGVPRAGREMAPVFDHQLPPPIDMQVIAQGVEEAPVDLLRVDRLQPAERHKALRLVARTGLLGGVTHRGLLPDRAPLPTPASRPGPGAVV
jgi:hypothetical protein